MVTKPTDLRPGLDEARAKRFQKEASAAGWLVPDDPIPTVSKVWTYSVNHEGRIRASGRLLHAALHAYRDRIKRFERLSLDEMAQSAVGMLDDFPVSDRRRTTALMALSCYFMNTAAWRNLDPDALLTGVHQLIIDWPHPSEPGRRVVRPAAAISPHMLTPDQITSAVSKVLDYERHRTR